MTSSPDRGRAVTPAELRERADGHALTVDVYTREMLRKAADRIGELEVALAATLESHKNIARTFVDTAKDLRALQYKYGLRSPQQDLERLMSILDEESP